MKKGVIGITGGLIAALGDEQVGEGLEGQQQIDCGGNHIITGPIDLQVNGGGGYMFNNDVDRELYHKIGAAHLESGTTTICPTVLTDTPNNMLKAIELLKTMMGPPTVGRARFGGIHLEGPFLSVAKRGAHAEELLQAVDLKLMEAFLEAGDGHIFMVTLAPELAKAPQLIEYLVEQNVHVSLGHTACSVEELRRGEQAGA